MNTYPQPPPTGPSPNASPAQGFNIKDLVAPYAKGANPLLGNPERAAAVGRFVLGQEPPPQ